MLGTIGSVASLSGAVISLLGLGFAILQPRKLRGETRAAREASESAERAIRRRFDPERTCQPAGEHPGTENAHRRGDRDRAFTCYRDAKSGLTNIELRHPNLTDDLLERIRSALSAITEMERYTDSRYTDSIEGALSSEQVSEFNNTLSVLDTDLVIELQGRMPGEE